MECTFYQHEKNIIEKVFYYSLFVLETIQCMKIES